MPATQQLPTLPLRRLGAVALLAVATACGDSPIPTAPASPPLADQPVLGKTTSAALDAFVVAQGTYCDDALLPCEPTYGDIGYTLGLGEAIGAPFMTIDVWGVNARWWPRHFTPIHPPFEYEGSIAEHRTIDGRRRITVNVRSRNTFSAVYHGDWTVALGADFYDYGTVDPIAAEASASVELLVPGDYVGYPDIMEVAWAPKPGMELVRYTASSKTEGTLRTDFNGIAAGTEVTASISGTWQPRHMDLRGRGVAFVRTDYSPGAVLQVKPVRR